MLADPASPSAAKPESVRSAYRNFVAALARADTLPEASRKKQLSNYMVEPQLSRVLEVAKRHQANGIASYGVPVIHVRDIQTQGDEAFLRDCQNAKNAGLLVADSGRKINRGIEKQNIKATLKRGADGRWRVSKSTVIGVGC